MSSSRKPKTFLTPEQVEELVAMWNAGNSRAACAKHFGCSAPYVARLLAKRPDAIGTGYFWSEADLVQLREMYESDESITVVECAKRFRASITSTRDHLLKMGVAIRFAPRVMSDHGNWQGGKIKRKGGYISVRCPDHPHATSIGYVSEHRLVVEAYIGRYLEPHEVVHHIDGDRTNNDISNLQVFSSNGEHLAHELKGRCPKWTPEGKARIEAAHSEWCQRQRSRSRSTADDRP